MMMDACLANTHGVTDVFIAHRIDADALDQLFGNIEYLCSCISHAANLPEGRRPVN